MEPDDWATNADCNAAVQSAFSELVGCEVGLLVAALENTVGRAVDGDRDGFAVVGN